MDFTPPSELIPETSSRAGIRESEWRKVMLTLDEALAAGMVKFKDERRLCTDCKFYNSKAWKGQCNNKMTQYKILHRCGGFTEKKVEEDKPFWL